MSDQNSANWRLKDLDQKVETPALKQLLNTPRVRALLAGIADHSPYLWQLIEADPDRVQRIMEDDPWSRLETLLSELRAVSPDETEAALMMRLRMAKQHVALLVALADLGGAWALEDVLKALSRAADTFIAVALSYLLRRLAGTGKLRLGDLDNPEEGSGIVVFGLGKLGGFELNYSSDVDLIVVFDPTRPAIVDRDTSKALFVRLVQDLVRLLHQSTAQGYVLRVDLRLRPDPSATAVAISLDSAFLYYETVGQNWERAALIKARHVAGDMALGQTFLKGLAPFIWRRYFDYAAIADIHAMKRQIHVVKGHADIAVAGHNVKLGRGGIREIEFFVQTQQLIFGGKRPELRGSQTLPMLRQLCRDGWISAHAVADLRRAYDFLRRIEHRLQMLADEQTHRLPTSPDALERFARFCGFSSSVRFAAVLTRHLRSVSHHYGLLFEHAPALDDVGGSLVFTGTGDDPETIETLKGLGYKSPEIIARIVREWHSGKSPGLRSARARETLTDLVPKLLLTFSRVFDPDAAVAAFDKALERMPAAAELVAILNANASLRTLFSEILGSAPRLAAEVILRPHLLDGAIDQSSQVCLDEDLVEERALLVLRRARTTEEFLDAIRDFHHEEHFLIGAALLAGRLDPDDAGAAYAALAVAIIRAVLHQLRAAFALDHGEVPNATLAIVAMGKLGSREMTAASDLDLVLLYSYEEDRSTSDGSRPLAAPQYFTRLAQRLVSHLTVASRRGRLYDVDMRLRPSGQQGPLATKLAAFMAYQREEAATWEHMALTRARVVAGDAEFWARVEAEISAILAMSSETKLRENICEMRALIAREKPPQNEWDLKLLPGGLIDIEFLAQYLVLRHCEEKPDVRDAATVEILRRAGRLGLMDADAARELVGAHQLFTNATQIMRLALEADQMPTRSGEAIKRWMATAANLPDFSRLEYEIGVARQAVRDIFRVVLSEG